MSPKNKQLSNPFSTGGGGLNFETRVQATFAVLMLTGSFAPCLPPWPIKKIKLQGKYNGFNTDDLIVFAKDSNSGQEVKLLAQIKRSIKITDKNPIFGEVIKSAWDDFKNPDIFTVGEDVFALITCFLSATDIKDVRTILEWARHASDANDFVNQVEAVSFSSNPKRSKLKAFRLQLKNANDGTDVSNEQLWEFMKSFHILGYDLDLKTGVTLSLLYSLIAKYSPKDAKSLWLEVVDDVQIANQNAGTLVIEKFSKTLRDAFKKQAIKTIPENLVSGKDTSKDVSIVANKDQIEYTKNIEYSEELLIAELIGAWDEFSEADKTVIEKLSGMTYAKWINKIRNILLQPETPLHYKNGKWNIVKLDKIWFQLGSRLFDDHLNRFKDIAVNVLKECNSQFESPLEERYVANMYGEDLSHSPSLRNGLAESLALLGSFPNVLTSCSLNKAETTASLAVKEILTDADWKLWGSLNDVLPLLAEAAPREFLDAVEAKINCDPCPFDILFAQEGNGIIGSNYLTGLLWALETLAWDEQYLSSVTVILGELATHDPGGNWANRPSNSLFTIFLPWLPQTTAPIKKRRIAIETLKRESPDIAWKLLLSLLPNANQTSSGSHKPLWRDFVRDKKTRSVTNKEYWNQINGYMELIIHIVKNDFSKLTDIISHLGDLPPKAYEALLIHLDSDEIVNMPETERFHIWTKLINLVSKHKKFADAKWAMKPKQVNKIAKITKRFEPSSPALLYQRLFSEREFDLHDEKGNREKQYKKLEKRQQQAVSEVFATSGMKAILEFAKVVESPKRMGVAFGVIAMDDIDQSVLPELLDLKDKSLSQFAGGFVWGKFHVRGWQWVDKIDTSQWTVIQIGQLLAYLPFKSDTWERSVKLLGKNESSYWIKTNANPYEADKNLELAIGCLVKYGRPHAAIRCLHRIWQEKKALDSQQAVRVLIAALQSSEKAHTMDVHYIVEIIKVLQDDKNTNPDDLFKVEWAYLPMLDRHNGASPKLLEQRLANFPDFFCEVIRIVFLSKDEKSPIKVYTTQQKNIAANAYRLLHEWHTPPGILDNGSFSGKVLNSWLNTVKSSCIDSGHIVAALFQVGNVLIHTPPDPDGLWIHHSVAEVLNARDADDMRKGYQNGIYNSWGAHCADSTGNQERKQATKYRTQADDVENKGYHRFATTLRALAESYDHDAKWIASSYPLDD